MAKNGLLLSIVYYCFIIVTIVSEMFAGLLATPPAGQNHLFPTIKRNNKFRTGGR